MRNQNYITNPKTTRKYEKSAKELAELETKIVILKSMGFEVFQSLKAGVNSSWSYSQNGINSGVAFDDQYGAWEHLAKQYAAEIDRLQASAQFDNSNNQ